jgi:hypothetical protein
VTTGQSVLVTVAAALAAAVAATHQLLAGAVAGYGSEPWRLAGTVLAWPWPLAQPTVSAVVAAVLLAIAVRTRRFAYIGQGLNWPLLVASVAAALGVAPMVLVCVGIAATWALVSWYPAVIVVALLCFGFILVTG